MSAHVYEQQDRHMKDSEILKRTWVYIKPYAWKLGLVLLALIFMIVLNLKAKNCMSHLLLKPFLV